MDGYDLDERLAAVAALADPLRRRLYRLVAAEDHPISRDEAAAATGVPRSKAAFHLDRLVAEGLLDTEYRRLSGRRGPGAGRPSKLYRPTAGDIAVSVPPRHYRLAADLLASAVTEATRTGSSVATATRHVARERGRTLAGGLAPPPPAQVEAIVEALAAEGYEPVLDGGQIVLTNCPFHGLVPDHAELVCGMNLALLEGFVEALPDAGLTARLEPSPRHCCVRLDLATSLPKEPLP